MKYKPLRLYQAQEFTTGIW